MNVENLTVEKNDPRLCIAGTEHLWTVCRKRKRGADISTEIIAENIECADALLFAAAPELLTVAKWVAETLPEIIRTSCAAGVPLSVSNFHELARAAVDKAERGAA